MDMIYFSRILKHRVQHQIRDAGEFRWRWCERDSTLERRRRSLGKAEIGWTVLVKNDMTLCASLLCLRFFGFFLAGGAWGIHDIHRNVFWKYGRLA